MSRTTPVYSARIYIFSSAELDSFDAFDHLVSLAENLSREICEYYTGSMVLIFRKCEAMLMALRRQKFLIVACLPLGGALVDVGKCETLVLYKDFVGIGPPIEVRLHLGLHWLYGMSTKSNRIVATLFLEGVPLGQKPTYVCIQARRPPPCSGYFNLVLFSIGYP